METPGIPLPRTETFILVEEQAAIITQALERCLCHWLVEKDPDYTISIKIGGVEYSLFAQSTEVFDAVQTAFEEIKDIAAGAQW